MYMDNEESFFDQEELNQLRESADEFDEEVEYSTTSP